MHYENNNPDNRPLVTPQYPQPQSNAYPYAPNQANYPYDPNTPQPSYPQQNPYQPQPQPQQVNEASYPTSQPNIHDRNDDFLKSEDEDGEYMRDIRRGFIKKVYSILSVTLLFTALLCVYPTTSKKAQDYMQDNIWIVILAAIGSLVPLYALFCVPKLARKVPTNYILLFAFVFFESILVAYSCASVGDPKIVLMAAFMTMGLTVILTIFACTTKIDFTV